MKLGPNQLEWIEALEKGEYKQGKGHLQLGECYCCLGVACRVAERHQVPLTITTAYLTGGSLEHQKSVIEFLALRDECGCGATYEELAEEVIGEYINSEFGCTVKTNYTVPALTQMNDQGLTHPQIALVLRKFPDVYFTEPK